MFPKMSITFAIVRNEYWAKFRIWTANNSVEAGMCITKITSRT